MYIIITVGHSGSGKTKLINKTIEYLNLDKNYKTCLVDDLIENNEEYKKKVKKIIKNNLETFEKVYFDIRKKYDYDRVNDEKIKKYIKNKENIVIETTGKNIPKWILSRDWTPKNYNIIIAYSLVSVKNLIKRNKERLEQAIKAFMDDDTNPAPRIPNLDKTIIKNNVKNIVKTLLELYENCIINHNIEIYNNVKINKLLVFDNNGKDMKIIYDNVDIIDINKFKEIICESFKSYMENYKIIKEMGSGMHGTVYLVKNKGKKYAMKVEQVFEKDLEKNLKSVIWREIDFAKNMSKKYPQQFMKIYDYENKKCNYVHHLSEEKWKSMNPEIKKYYKDLFASPYCSIKITNIVDNMLHNIIYKINNKKVILDLFIQVVNLAYIINKEGYYHRDLHPKNIGVVKTKNKYIKILDKKVLTHGYILSAIDYGMVLHKKYILEKWEINALKYDNDLHTNFYKIIFKIMLKNLINKYPDINKKVPISDKDAKTLKPILENIKIDNSKWIKNNYDYFQELLYKILFFDKFQEQLGINDKVELYEFIPLESVIFIVKHFYDLEKILNHLISLE